MPLISIHTVAFEFDSPRGDARTEEEHLPGGRQADHADCAIQSFSYDFSGNDHDVSQIDLEPSARIRGNDVIVSCRAFFRGRGEQPWRARVKVSVFLWS